MGVEVRSRLGGVREEEDYGLRCGGERGELMWGFGASGGGAAGKINGFTKPIALAREERASERA